MSELEQTLNSARQKRYYEKHKNDIQARRLAYYRANPMAQAIRNAKVRAKKRGLEFSLVKEDLFIPEYCPVLGIKLEIANRKKRWNSPSLDRIDNSKGYTKDNVRVISSRANSLKSNMSIEECELILKDLKCPQK